MKAFAPGGAHGSAAVYAYVQRSAKTSFWVRAHSGGVRVFRVKGWGEKVEYVPRNREREQTFWQDNEGKLPRYPGNSERPKLEK